jgi:hypothetical protein
VTKEKAFNRKGHEEKPQRTQRKTFSRKRQRHTDETPKKLKDDKEELYAFD